MYAGNPILDEIKQGFKLRPTKTVDKSKPIFLAEGEDLDSVVAPTRRAPAGIPAGPSLVPPAQKTRSPSPAKETNGAAPPLPSSAPPPPPPSGCPPPPPPPPMMAGSSPSAPPPPPPSLNRTKSPALLKLGGSAPTDVDRGQLLKGIQGGIRLRKTVTNDKSGLVVDDELKSKSVKLVQPVEPPPMLNIQPPRSDSAGSKSPATTPRDRTMLGPDSSEDERYLTPDERMDSDYGTPEPPEDRQSWRRTPEPAKPVKIDYVFEEKNLRVTSDDLKQEIPTGSAAARIAKFSQGAGGGGATLPRATFRPPPQRSTFPKEMNNNCNGDVPSQKSKAPSKWAPVEVGGLKRPSMGNVPFEKTPEPVSRPQRERSASALEQPSVERARTQSPATERATSTLPAPISVRTDFSSSPSPSPKPAKVTSSAKPSSIRQPDIQETPPTPKSSTTTYTYNKSTNYRSSSPSETAQPSPVSSMSSASLPSPSSLSPGNTSPESTPRRRVNPGFDKAKEKFSGAATNTTSPSLPAPRPFFLKGATGLRGSSPHSNSVSPLSSPRGSISGPASRANDKEVEAVKSAVKKAAAERQRRVINVPISAPWHTRRETFEPSSTRSRYERDPYEFSSLNPSDFRRNYRFNIDLNSESPLSIINR